MTILLNSATIGEKHRLRKKRRRIKRLVLAILAVACIGVYGPNVRKELSTLLHGGHNPDATPVSISIADQTLDIPANMIRFAHERKSGSYSRVHLYFDWPAMKGYRAAARDSFNNTQEDGAQNILFATVEPHLTLRDMSGRFEAVYSHLIQENYIHGVRGVRLYRFKPTIIEYAQEILVYAERDGLEPFVALCMKGAWARELLASCTRDVHINQKLSISYQFPNALLARWPEMENAVMKTAFSFLPVELLGTR